MKNLMLGAICVGMMFLGGYCIMRMQDSSSTYSGETTQSERATFAGGCFWCIEHDFEQVHGVKSAISGYMGGDQPAPTYADYAKKGHIEVVEVTYDPAIVTYQDLLDVFWRSIDPTDSNGQFADRGSQYRPVIFYHSEEQLKQARASKDMLVHGQVFSRPITVPIIEAGTLYPAEEYHQDYAKKNPLRYKLYRYLSGRDAYLQNKWKKVHPPSRSHDDIKRSPEKGGRR